MKNHNKELIANTIILGIGQLIPKFLSFIVLPILTIFLTEEEYGEYDLILSCIGLIIPLSTLQIQQAVFRYLISSKEDKSKEEYITSSILYVIVSSSVAMLIAFFVLMMSGKNMTTTMLICCLFFAEALYSLLGQIIRGMGFNKKYSMSVIVYSASNLAMTAILVAGFKLGLTGVICSLIIGFFMSDIFMIVSSKMYRYISLRNFSRDKLGELLKFSVPIVPSSISLWIVNMSDRLIILHYLGVAANGIYAVANKIPLLYNTIYSIFNLAWTETATKVADDGDPTEYYTDMFKKLFNFLIGGMLLLISVTPLIFKLFVRGDGGFDSAIDQVSILYIGVFFNSFVNFYSGIYIALKRTKQVGISSAAGAVINLIVNILLIQKIGLYAASISTAVSYCVIALYRAYDIQKVIKISYHVKGIFIGILLLIVSCVLFMCGNTVCIIFCFVIAMLFNFKANYWIIDSGIKILQKKIKG